MTIVRFTFSLGTSYLLRIESRSLEHLIAQFPLLPKVDHTVCGRHMVPTLLYKVPMFDARA